MITVTLFTKYVYVLGQFALKVIFERIGNGFYEKLITPLRNMYEAGDMKGFNEGKSKLDAVTFCATHEGGRDKAHRTGYNKLIIGDIDHVSEADLQNLRQKIISCDRVLACFVSPSGHGLKFIVPVSTGEEDHLMAYNCVMHFFELLLGIPIDRSGKDISRLCYVTDDPNIYVNWNAKVFDPYMGQGKPVYPPKPAGPVLQAGNVKDPGNEKQDLPPGPEPVSRQGGHQNVRQGGRKTDTPPHQPETFFEIYERCIKWTRRYHQYIEGQRNIFVYVLACTLCRAGFTESDTMSLLLQDFNYDEREVRSSVKSAYRTNSANPSPVPVPGDHNGPYAHPHPKTDHPAPEGDPANKTGGKGKKRPSGDGTEYQSDATDAEKSPPPPARKEKRNNNQGPLYSLNEVENYIRAHYETRNNVVSGKLEWRFAHCDTPFVEMDDIVINSLYCDLHHQEQYIPYNTLYLLLNSNFSPLVNPFTEYFGRLVWDGKTDYIGQLADTVKTQDKEHWDFCIRKWVVAFAAGMVEDQVINHTVIVLVGNQGIGKTSWIRRILPDALREYMGTSTVLNDSKDTSIQLSECGLIILDEIESLTKKELAALKEFLTRSNVHIRKPYGRFSVNLVRRASVVCSLNREDLLTDTTGSRRFLCFKVSAIDYMHKVDMDGVMAQAYALFRSGFRYWLDQEEISTLHKHNERFYAKSVEQEMIETWLRPVTQEEWNNRNKFASDSNIKLLTSTQIAGEILGRLHVQITDFSINKIGRILIKLGFICVIKHSKSMYMVRVLDGDTVAANNRTIDEDALILQEQEENEQYIRFEEDLAGGPIDGVDPF